MNDQNKVLLVKPVKHIDASSNKLSGTDWRTMGEFEMTIGDEADGLISAWMTEVLSPLDLHTDFLNKILKSAQEAAARSIQADTMMVFEHIHLLVFAPRENASKRKTWGFFRIEKIGTPTANENPHDHSIEFYLYLEG